MPNDLTLCLPNCPLLEELHQFLLHFDSFTALCLAVCLSVCLSVCLPVASYMSGGLWLHLAGKYMLNTKQSLDTEQLRR